MRIVLVVIVASAAYASCPEGQVCIDKDKWSQVRGLLAKLKKVEESEPVLTMSPFHITIDRSGRVFTDSTGSQKGKAKMVWGDFDVDLEYTITAEMHQAVESDWGFRLRIKALAMWLPLAVLEAKEWKESVDFGVGLEPFYWKIFAVQLHAGARTVGGGLNIDITNNFGAYLAAGVPWATPSTLAVMTGVGMSFN